MRAWDTGIFTYSGQSGTRIPSLCSPRPLEKKLCANPARQAFDRTRSREAFTKRAFQQMLGYSEEELSHLENWDKIVHPDDRASSAKRYAELQQGKRDITERKKWRRNETASPQIRRLHQSSGAKPHLPSIQDERKLPGGR